MNESFGELLRPVKQDKKLNEIVQDGILQPISAIHNPYAQKLTYVNSNIQFTNPAYDFSHDIPDGLPYMLVKGDKKSFPDALLYCRPHHYRTGILTSQSGILLDNVLFPYLDEKGVGHLNEEFTNTNKLRYAHVKVVTPQAIIIAEKPRTYGLADLSWVSSDADATDSLYQDGIRIVPTIAILEMSRIPNEYGDFISLEEAITRGFLAADTIPAIQFRAFVTPYRAADLIDIEPTTSAKNETLRRKMLLRAFDDMSKDQTISVDLSEGLQSTPKYLQWFSKTFGQNLARLHKKNKIHRYLAGMHNVTLDARMVDSDSLETDVSDDKIYFERFSLFSTDGDISMLRKFYNSVIMLSQSIVNPDTFLIKTLEAYTQEFRKD